jgi:hypothetical protein
LKANHSTQEVSNVGTGFEITCIIIKHSFTNRLGSYANTIHCFGNNYYGVANIDQRVRSPIFVDVGMYHACAIHVQEVKT